MSAQEGSSFQEAVRESCYVSRNKLSPAEHLLTSGGPVSTHDVGEVLFQGCMPSVQRYHEEYHRTKQTERAYIALRGPLLLSSRPKASLQFSPLHSISHGFCSLIAAASFALHLLLVSRMISGIMLPFRASCTTPKAPSSGSHTIVVRPHKKVRYCSGNACHGCRMGRCPGCPVLEPR